MPIKFYLYIFIIIFSKPAFSEIINENNLFKREGLFFNKFTNELFTGSVEFKYKNGKIRSRGSFKMGKEEGYWEDYNEDGSFFSKGNYINGKPHGNFKFYHENGILEEEGDFIFGIKTGNWNTYWDNVNLKKEGIWKNGKANGLFKFYNFKGEILKVETWENGIKVVNTIKTSL